ncbi:MAG: DNA-3-methyladenine glycosylase family protein [Bdellovibrionota bacterium]
MALAAKKNSSRKRLPRSRKAAEFLSSSCPKLKAHIKKVGPPEVFYEPSRSVFQALVTAITHQQLHGKAAETILGRFAALFPGPFPTPKAVLKAELASLHSCGLSRAKAAAIVDLAMKVQNGTVPTREMALGMSNDELIESITQVKGIGRWTVEMFLIFTLGRPDIFPVHDFGVRKGYAVLYRKRKFPSPKELEKLGERFSPHRSTLAWYLWRAADLRA